jgi:hypothetical protein
MGPAEVSALSNIIQAAAAIGRWPIIYILYLLIVGPWVLAILLSLYEHKRLAAAIKMYEDNVELVKGYANVAGDLKDIVIMDIQNYQKLKDLVENNQFCPMIRLEKKAKGIQT